MKVGIVTIATGKYWMFINDLVKSFESFFLPEFDKEYFIFTDNESPDINGENIHIIKHEKEEWPYASLLRFKHIYSKKDFFNNVDYLFFSNANMKAIRNIEDQIIPVGDLDFSAVLHPGYYLDEINRLPYERDPNSLAYIPYWNGSVYYQGCFYGGKIKHFLDMCKTISDNTDEDLSKGIIASVHDESHLNKYLIDKRVLNLSSVYSYPEQILHGEYEHCISYRDLAKKEPLIIQVDKRKFGGHDFLRK
jgi:hypothetical protein